MKKKSNCVFLLFVLSLFLFPSSAQTYQQYSLLEGDYFEPAAGYYFDILYVDPYYGEAQFSLTRDGNELLNWVYYEGSNFYYDDAFLTLSFTIVDTVTESGLNYVIISDYYVFEKTDTTTTGTVAVSSDPSGASVYLDGYYFGETDFESLWIYSVQEGFHEIELVKDGYYTSTESIYVYAGETMYYSNTLDPMVDPWEIVYMIIGLLILLVIFGVPVLFLAWLLMRKKKPKATAPQPSKPSSDIVENIAEPVSPPVTSPDQPTPISIKSAFAYLGAIIHYKIKVENHSPEPIGDIKVMLFAPDVFLVKEREKSISMLEPGESKTVTFELRPTGECGDCMISGTIEYYDYGSKKRNHMEIDSRLVSIVCPVLTRKEITEDQWRQTINELIKAEEDSKDLDIPAENLFDMVTRVLKDMNLYMISPEITTTPQLFTGVARFYAEGAAGLRYAAYMEVVGKRKSRLILKAWAEKEESLTGFYHKMLEEIEKRTDIRIFVDEGVYQYNISNTTIKDSVVQRSRIDGIDGVKKNRCPNCGRDVRGDEKYCIECGEKLE